MAIDKAAKQAIEEMSARDRVWEGLKYGYEKQAEQSGAGYDREISGEENAQMKRGMHRSSYGRQIVAGLRNQKMQARNDLGKAMIADYGNRLYQIERDEKADEQWQMGFDEGVRQFNENMGFQRERATVQDRQWQMGFDEGVRQFNESMAWNRENAATQAAQWQSQFDAANSQWQWEADFKKAQADAAAAASASRSSGGSRGSGGTTPVNSTPSDAALLAMYAVNGTANTAHKGASTAYNSVKNLFKK